MPNLGGTIVLVGLMGSGKTRIGSELARLMKLPFVDADREIEQAANCTVSEIFERFGEKEFRQREKQIMLRLLSGEAKILASGGGAFIQNDVRNAIKNSSISVWLNTNLNVLIERTSRSNRRPILQGAAPAEKLRELMEARYPIYAEADITVVTDRQTPHDVAQRIKMEVDRLVSQRKDKCRS